MDRTKWNENRIKVEFNYETVLAIWFGVLCMVKALLLSNMRTKQKCSVHYILLNYEKCHILLIITHRNHLVAFRLFYTQFSSKKEFWFWKKGIFNKNWKIISWSCTDVFVAPVDYSEHKAKKIFNHQFLF